MDFPGAKEFVINKLEKELKPTLYYHNFQHTLDVVNSVATLATMERVNGEELMILRTAALYHDTGFLWQYDNNEAIACDFARVTLPGFGYDKSSIEKVTRLILETKVPQHPTSLLSQIICDADLDYIGREDFFITALRLHREWSENSARKITFKEWYLNQLNFVKQHEYFTFSAKSLRNNRKKKNLAQIRELLNLLETSVNNKKKPIYSM